MARRPSEGAKEAEWIDVPGSDGRIMSPFGLPKFPERFPNESAFQLMTLQTCLASLYPCHGYSFGLVTTQSLPRKFIKHDEFDPKPLETMVIELNELTRCYSLMDTLSRSPLIVSLCVELLSKHFILVKTCQTLLDSYQANASHSSLHPLISLLKPLAAIKDPIFQRLSTTLAQTVSKPMTSKDYYLLATINYYLENYTLSSTWFKKSLNEFKFQSMIGLSISLCMHSKFSEAVKEWQSHYPRLFQIVSQSLNSPMESPNELIDQILKDTVEWEPLLVLRCLEPILLAKESTPFKKLHVSLLKKATQLYPE